MTKTNKFLFIYGLIMFFAMSLGAFTQITILGASMSIYWIDIFAITLLVLILLLPNIFTNKFSTSENLLALGLVIILVYSMFISFFSDEQLTSLQGSLVIFLGIIYLICSVVLNNNNKYFFRWAVRIFVSSIAIQLIINMLPIFMSAGLSFYLAKENATTFVGNSNAISFYFVFLVLYELISRHKFWSFFVVIGIIGVVFSMSRAGFLSLFICLSIFVVISIINKSSNNIKTYFYMIIAIVLLYFAIQNTAIGKQFLFHLGFGLKATSMHARDVLGEEAWSKFLQHPFGSGLVWIGDPHNIIIRSFRDLGFIVGPIFIMILFFPIFFFFSRKIRDYSNEMIAILVAYCSLLVHSLFEIFFLTNISLFFTIFSLVYLVKNKSYQYLNDK
ncbi:hypothetical protein [Macrococcus capreoli]|uniref:hypothetical protein n=1 Tax=Macrococcus capreoli TaxID=2982690 RepID=UPI0021D59049|nr:hypothetical protein [Macrococcus sp. TMW 2.2395]MCU7557548.1 hypothetical protein [Macrococcus sp. TMW 2.2395]